MHMNIKSSRVSIIVNRTLECAYQKCVYIIKMICMRGIAADIAHLSAYYDHQLNETISDVSLSCTIIVAASPSHSYVTLKTWE